MNQIPSRSKFCRNQWYRYCPCFDWHQQVKCQLYDEELCYSIKKSNWKRLPICIQERPQIVKGKEGKEDE